MVIVVLVIAIKMIMVVVMEIRLLIRTVRKLMKPADV
jgi:hypothetical protein